MCGRAPQLPKLNGLVGRACSARPTVDDCKMDLSIGYAGVNFKTSNQISLGLVCIICIIESFLPFLSL